MADDVFAPNVERIRISDELSEADFCRMILAYLPKGNHRWRGYCDGTVLADVIQKGAAREVVLREAWKDRVLRFRAVHFLNSKGLVWFRDMDELPEQDPASKKMDYSTAAKLFMKAYDNTRK